MDYKKSSWVKKGDPKFEGLFCEDHVGVVDGFFSNPGDKEFTPCLEKCKKCLGAGVCSECADPNDNSVSYFVYKAQNPHQCLRCSAENSRYKAGLECKDCPTECSRCSSPSSCTVCKKGHYILDLSPSGRCERCPEIGYKIESGKCLKLCPGKNQHRSSKNECITCPENCTECNEDTGLCTKCDDDYVIAPSTRLCERVANPILITDQYYSEVSQKIELTFNQKLTTSNLKDNLKLTLSDPSGGVAERSLRPPKQAYLDTSYKTIHIIVDFAGIEQTFTDFDIVITESTEGTIRAANDSRVRFTKYPVRSREITLFLSPLSRFIISAGKSASVLMQILSFILVLLSISMAIAMIKVFQLIFFLLFINIRLPSNATQFIFSFRKNIIDYIPPLLLFGDSGLASDPAKGSFVGGIRRRGLLFERFRLLQQSSSNQAVCIPHRKFEENQLRCNVFFNNGSFIIEIIISLSLKLFIVLLIRLFTKGGKKG